MNEARDDGGWERVSGGWEGVGTWRGAGRGQRGPINMGQICRSHRSPDRRSDLRNGFDPILMAVPTVPAILTSSVS
jgi:hypothetical protein